jgi:GH15 family glucan-1,4-alpha-glucosidase
MAPSFLAPFPRNQPAKPVPSTDSNRYLPIEDHGVIGDLHTVALVGIDGTIDFLCFPFFDSPSVFASLLDADKGGCFRIGPTGPVRRRRQMYLPDSNVLLTRFLAEDGVAELSDFMPVEAVGRAHNLVRRVKCVRGSMRFTVRCEPRFDYARAQHRVERSGEALVFVSEGRDGTVLKLSSSVPLAVQDGAATAEFTLQSGEHAFFILEGVEEGGDTLDAGEAYVTSSFKDTVNFWRTWIGGSNYRGRWREMVNRSALMLKLLTSSTYGSIVASPTFGLPEELGGMRNWDYRYTWLRDASFTLYALLRLGFKREAAAFNQWVEKRCEDAQNRPLQIMYALDGRRRLAELELTHLEGYAGSGPVRIGNAAYGQLQLDIYGELMDSIYLFDRYGDPIHHDLWQHMARLVDWVCDNWDQPDEGIWEVRGGRKHFLYSRVMCWVALDRALRLARRRSLPCPTERWQAARDTIHQQVFERFYDARRGAFVQSLGSTALDASACIMPLVRMIGPTDPKWLSTMAAIERELVDDSLVYRYRVEDGLVGGEGTFSICTFWFVECLSRAGDLDKARFLFEKMLGHANHLGLFGEELGPCGEHLGNFPQAFTHLALISAAYDLDRRLGRGA